MPNDTRSHVGEIRPSHLLREFGVGAVIDLPNLSVMVMGLEDWDALYQQPQEVGEERLRSAVQRWLGEQVTHLRTPPVSSSQSAGASFAGYPAGVPVAAFPRWMVCPYCHLLAPVDSGLFQLKTVPHRPDRSRYVHINCTKPGQPTPVLPARYITACEQGHVDEFPWVFYVHQGRTECTARLTVREAGFSSDVADVWVRCETCGASRSMAQAFGKAVAASMPQCRGRHPHLRAFSEEPCSEQLSTLLLGASNSWFPVGLQALSVPRDVDPLSGLIDMYWVHLEKSRNPQDIDLMRSLGLIPLLARHSNEEVWSFVEAKRKGSEIAKEQVSDLKVPEWRIFAQGGDIPTHPFLRIRNALPPVGLERLFERVALADRLRLVNALVGFTRLSSFDDLSELHTDEDALRERLAPLSRKAPTWVPAYEVHGEGIFLQFNENAIIHWLSSHHDELRSRNEAFTVAHYRWREKRHLQPAGAHYPGLRYILLHSFAHALMRQLALEAGYSMASLSERIYSRGPTDLDGPMAGVLIFTSAPDSEGTLGGLVRLGAGDELRRHIFAALENIRWCASDPLCAGHSPLNNTHGLHGAACHACLFAPETSCERGNRYLDRSILIPTIEHSNMAFFSL